MKLSPRVVRWFFYGLVVSGAAILTGTVFTRGISRAAEAAGVPATWVLGACCALPIVLAMLALANESRGMR